MARIAYRMAHATIMDSIAAKQAFQIITLQDTRMKLDIIVNRQERLISHKDTVIAGLDIQVSDLTKRSEKAEKKAKRRGKLALTFVGISGVLLALLLIL